MMLSILLCAYWPFIDFRLSMPIQMFCPIFYCYLFSDYWVVWVFIWSGHKSLSDIVAKIVFQSVICLFIFLMVSFGDQIFFFFWPCCVACGILVPQPGIAPVPLQWKHLVLTTGPPGNSPGDQMFLNFDKVLFIKFSWLLFVLFAL